MPLGWSKSIEFSDGDKRAALEAVDCWVTLSKQRESLPVEALRTLLTESVYGGKLETQNDREILSALVDKVFARADYLSAAEDIAPIPSGSSCVGYFC